VSYPGIGILPVLKNHAMARPETAQDVVELIRRGGLVGEPHLARVLPQLQPGAGPEGVLGLLVATGLLTRYQAEEVAAGRWRGLWLGGYRVLDRLGKGGMSHVFLAEHAVLGKRVAVKVLSVGLRADPSARQRFVREARAAATVDHANIVHVFDVDMDNDPPFLVMEYVDGVSLQAAVARHGALTAAETATVGVEVALGLAAAAAAGLVHRDIKPANLLVDRRGRVKILDLGIVRLPGEDTLPRGDGGDAPDGTDTILGTLDYLAPEQAQNSSAVDPRADVYSLGATLYFLLAGHPPFPGSDVRHKLAAKQYTDPLPIHRLRPDADVGLSAAIHSMLARDPTARCPSAADAATALAPFASPTPPDFPARLFRPSRPSTGDPSKEHAALLPITERIRKPVLRPPSPDDSGEHGCPTDLVTKAPTDPMMAALPDSAVVPKSGSQWLPLLFRWLVIVMLSVLVGIALALAWMGQ
jgi:serine/threonine-protein kinase